MKKIKISIILLITFLFTTACTNYNNSSRNISSISVSENNSVFMNSINNENDNMITFPIELVIKDKREVIEVNIDKESTLQEKIELIVNTMSQEAFNGLPINVTVYSNEMAKIVLKEFSDSSSSSRFSWEKDYLSKNNEEVTINTLVKNILQEQYKGPWIKTIKLYYEDELIILD